jgi:diguanylate cyclase (GGDEF)-like protein
MVQVTDPVVVERRFYDSCENSQGLWFASGSGLIHFAGSRFSQVNASGRTAAEGFDGIACGADGSLWLGGTMTGANTGVTHVVFHNGIAEAQEMPELASVETLFVRRDHRNWIWIGSGSGVYVFNGNHWAHVTQKDGLAWDDCAENAFFEDNDGSIWIGTSSGLSHLLHPEYLFSLHPLEITTLSASLGTTEIPLSGTPPSFDWTREPLRVHIASSAIARQGSVFYRYRLGGLEDEWGTSRSPEINYSALPDGKYHFYVYAEDVDRALRSPMTEIAFRIRPPWWRGIPFRTAMGMALLAIVYGLLRFRERSLRARQQHLEQLVRQRTAELEREKQQLMDAREALREQASRDALTGLLNYGAIHDVLCRELARTEREGPSISAVMIDIDHFKSVNDQYGHMVGDQVLREVARRLTDSIRPYDTVGRYGGEEFLLIMPDFDALQDMIRLEAIHDAICVEPIPLSHGRVKITCSFGVSVMHENEIDGWEEFLDRADKALYRAKHGGRNRIAYDIPSVSR